MAAPGITKPLTIDEYLRSPYRPDVDFVGGYIEERNWGEYNHARLQALLAFWFGTHEREWNVRVVVEQRVQVSETSFRIPDVSLLRRELPIEQIIRTAPLVCIEILSPEDSVHKMRVRFADYHRMGVENVWLLDPESRAGFICTPSGISRPVDGILAVPGTEINIPLMQAFSGLDEM